MRIYSLYAMEYIETQRRFFRQSQCNAKKKKLRKSLASLVEKLQISLTNGKLFSKLIGFFSFSLISD